MTTLTKYNQANFIELMTRPIAINCIEKEQLKELKRILTLHGVRCWRDGTSLESVDCWGSYREESCYSLYNPTHKKNLDQGFSTRVTLGVSSKSRFMFMGFKIISFKEAIELLDIPEY